MHPEFLTKRPAGRSRGDKSACWIVLIFFIALIIHGSTIGLTDDEAYYWVLSQSPALGYAYHPPIIAWMIWVFQKTFSWLVDDHTAGLVRLPAVLGVSTILLLCLKWFRILGLDDQGGKRLASRSLMVVLSFCGFFALSWMMVPDIPLFLGWMLLFLATWRICFGDAKFPVYFMAGLGSGILLLSKYSGVLAIFSACSCLWIWASPKNRWQGIAIIAGGLFAAAFPIVIWNANHEWVSILYQIRDRHQGSEISPVRYLRFWLIELALCGPIAVIYGVWIFKEGLKGKDGPRVVYLYLAVWALPAALVFGLQPLFSDFKPHWAFMIWWPLLLGLAWSSRDEGRWKWIRYQCVYGFLVSAFILISCHIPLGNWLIQNAMGEKKTSEFNPKLDVTNDLYGWSNLRNFLDQKLTSEEKNLPVVGSRYQTASQAAFALNGHSQVTLLPRGVKDRDEWPDLKVSETDGPEWPKLKTSVIYIADNRYTEAPGFKGASCTKRDRLNVMRKHYLVKWIDIWRCDPN